MSSVRTRRRRRVANRAQGRCEYCQTPEDYSPSSFELEHIFPKALGGDDDEANLAFSCGGCNNEKSDAITALDVVSGELTPLFHPRKHDWSEHFAWSDDGEEIRGLTAIGRATALRLRFNRPGLVNLRRALVAVGKHPGLSEAVTQRLDA